MIQKILMIPNSSIIQNEFQLVVWTLIILKSAVIPPSSMVMYFGPGKECAAGTPRGRTQLWAELMLTFTNTCYMHAWWWSWRWRWWWGWWWWWSWRYSTNIFDVVVIADHVYLGDTSAEFCASQVMLVLWWDRRTRSLRTDLAIDIVFNLKHKINPIIVMWPSYCWSSSDLQIVYLLCVLSFLVRQLLYWGLQQQWVSELLILSLIFTM